VIAMVAQIRAGLWVRNGFAIRGQVMHYRDFMLRELCYDQDLFILQTAMVILDPNSVIVTMLDRFQLLGYFSGATLHHVYDNAQMANMVEEFLYVLITVLTETANATKMPLPEAVRREIVHALALGPCTYTELVKRVAERKSDDICFDRVLNEVANFRAPESIADSGMYELKDEAFDEVNPFFYHHTRNKREEVEVVLKNRLKKRTGEEDPVLVPKPLDITRGPFTVLTSVFESEVLLQVIFYGIFNVVTFTDSSSSAPPSAEAILDQCLHLLMLALVERPQSFGYISVNKIFEEGQTLLDAVCSLERSTTYNKAYKARVQWILNQLAQYQPQEVKTRQAPEPSVHVDPEEAKKRAAKARKEALMKQMKAQQASFATNFEDIDDEDEDEDLEQTEAPVSYGTCIVCQEELNAARAFGSLGLIQPSRFLRRYPDTQQGYINDVLSAPDNLDRSSDIPHDTSFPPQNAETEPRTVSFDGFPPSATRFGLHSSICSHMMHLECFVVYSSSVRQRLRSQLTRNHPENIARKEYICPLCKCLGNVILPVVVSPPEPELNTVPFHDWIRAAGISILKSKPDPVIESLQSRLGTGESTFWGAQDAGYQTYARTAEKMGQSDLHKMVDTMMVIVKNVSAQTRHLRDRPETNVGEPGAGMYLPEDLVGYTIACLEVAQRGTGLPGSTIADSLSDSQTRMIQGLIACLSRLAAWNFRGRPDEGRETVKHAIIKRLLPEWSRSSFTSYSYPLLLRDPFTILVETATVAPEILKHILVLTYYACLARTVVGLLYILNKTRAVPPATPPPRQYEDIFGDIRMFFMSVIRPSPVFEHAAEVTFQAFGDARIEKLMYTFTLPFLRRAVLLCRAVLPGAFPSPTLPDDACEYRRLLAMLGIPPLADLPRQDTLQNALSGWCAHYGHSPAASQLNCGISLDHPLPYQTVRLPLVLDTLFLDQERTMVCTRCKSVPQDAAVCLLCGMTLCFQSHCCMDHDSPGRGECNMHMRECVAFSVLRLWFGD
jgi:E3 ubiquitin-protein ligase UBR1